MDENTKAIVDALEQLKSAVNQTSPLPILAEILKELNDIGRDVGLMDR